MKWTLLSFLNKCNIIIYNNGINNDDNDKNSGSDNSGDRDTYNDNINEGNSTKILSIEDKQGTYINYGTTIPYIHYPVSGWVTN